jgi:YidC/Oxa1 family membrane protein insertase
MKLLKPLLSLLGPLMALAAVGSASAAETPNWIQKQKSDWIRTQNFNGKPATIFTSNLADVVFNDQGEIIGWYVKQAAGGRLIDNKDGQPDFGKLLGEKGTVNLVRGGSALRVNIAGNTAAPAARPVQTFRDSSADQNPTRAVFTYSQGAATVTKTVTVHPRQFNMQVAVNVVGATGYSLSFDGLGKNANPGSKSLAQGGQVVQGPTTVQNTQYAALFDTLTTGFLGLGSNSYTAHMLVVRPGKGNTAPFSATVADGQKASLTLGGLSGATQLDVYGGKNELIHLYQEGYTALPGLFTPNIFGTISLYLVKFMEYLYTFLKSWGLVIFVFTILLRLAIWPLMQSQGRTTAKMQMVQPLQKELQEKYKDDPQRLQQETMRLYKENNVNPAGCLSMFIPLPILAVLFSTFRNFEFDQGLWWLPDLSLPDPFYILAVLYVAANLLQLYISTRKSPQMFKQQSFIYIIYLYFALTFPAGVTLYWIISTLIGAGQQYLINKQVEAQMAGGLSSGSGTILVEKVKGGPGGAAKTSLSKATTVKPSQGSKVLKAGAGNKK